MTIGASSGGGSSDDDVDDGVLTLSERTTTAVSSLPDDLWAESGPTYVFLGIPERLNVDIEELMRGLEL
jgi:hypothetical protein